MQFQREYFVLSINQIGALEDFDKDNQSGKPTGNDVDSSEGAQADAEVWNEEFIS